MLRRVAIVRTDVSEELSASLIRLTKIGELAVTRTDSCHPDEGGAKFLRNVRSYKSHTALTSQKTPFFSLQKPLTWADSLYKQAERRNYEHENRDMEYPISVYCRFTVAVSSEVTTHKLDLVELPKVM
jgi:hypothetical protein